MKNWLIKIYVGIGFIMFLLCNPCSSGGAVNPVEIIKVAFKSAIWPYILYEEFRGDDAIPQLNLIIKANTNGSAEAVSQAIAQVES